MRAVCLFLAASMAAGCGSKKEGDKPTGSPETKTKTKAEPGKASTAKPPDAPREEVIKYTKTDLGKVSADPQWGADRSPLVTMSAGGQPVVAYDRNRKIFVTRWEGGAWKPVGDMVTCAGALHRRALAVDAAGAVFVAGTIDDKKAGHQALACVAQATDAGWTVLGAPVGDDSALAGSLALVATADGPVVFLVQAKGDEEAIMAWRWDGSAWHAIEKPPVGAEMHVSRVAAAPLPDGLVLAWLQRKPQQPMILEVQHWVAATNQWERLPSVADVDGDTSFELASSSDGEVVLARSWNPGFKEVLRWAPGDANWTSLKIPGDNRGYTSHDLPAVAAGRKGEVVLAWAGDRIEVAVHDGKMWNDAVRGLGRKPKIQMSTRVAAAPDGSFVVVWRDADSETLEPGQILAAMFKPTP